MLAKGRKLLPILFCRFVRNEVACPDLPMWMWIRASHYVALILEHLNPAVIPAHFFALLGPHIPHAPNCVIRHFRQRPIVPRRKTDHPAGSGDRLAAQKSIVTVGRRFSVWQDRSKIVGENIASRVHWVLYAAGAIVSRAEITFRIVRGARLARRPLLSALPWPFSSMRR